MWCCGDEGTYEWSLLSEYAFFIKHKSMHGRWTIYLGRWRNLLQAKYEPSSTLYTLALMSYDWWVKCQFILFPMACVQISYQLSQIFSAVSLCWDNLIGCNLASLKIATLLFLSIYSHRACTPHFLGPHDAQHMSWYIILTFCIFMYFVCMHYLLLQKHLGKVRRQSMQNMMNYVSVRSRGISNIFVCLSQICSRFCLKCFRLW